MNYSKIYNSIIERAKIRKIEGYFETHHIIPLCLGGVNSKDNLVTLTAREHFLCHWLLYKIHRTSKLAHAWHSMCRIGIGQDERLVNSKHFERARKAHSEVLKNTTKGKGNHFFGKKHSEKTRKVISEKAKERKTWLRMSKSHKENLLASQRKPKSEEHRKKIGRPGLIIVQNIHSFEIKRIPKDSDYDKQVWVNPRKVTPEKKIKCSRCGKETNAGNIKRWHEENCKHKESGAEESI